MPTDHIVTSFKFSELSAKSQEKARDWYRNGAFAPRITEVR